MTPTPDTIVLIHGLWMTSRSWEHWTDRYRAAGLNVIDAGWPGMDLKAETLGLDSVACQLFIVSTSSHQSTFAARRRALTGSTRCRRCAASAAIAKDTLAAFQP